MKKIVLLFWVMLLPLIIVADEDFDSFDDEETSFVIKTKKPKIIVKKDSIEDTENIKFLKESMGKNSAVSMSVKNFLIFSKLKSIESQYVVLELSLQNILKSQKVIVSKGSAHPANWVSKSSDDFEYKEMIPLYQIPDIMQHLYLRVNNSTEKAIDVMSLLLDKPLINYNSNTVEITPENLKEGQLAFRLEKGKKVEQLSLHYYDTKYGNIDIPIVGEMKQKSVNVTTLSKTKWEKMGENFSLTVSGYDITDKVKENQAHKGGQFEIVEIDIESKVYALLQFDPSKRFYLNIGDTHSIKLHPITQALPMGLYSSASLSPGSNNKFRLAFYVPKGMEKLSRSLMVELQGDDIVLPIKKGEDGAVKQVLSKGTVEGTSLDVNGVYLHDEKILVDITFNDEKDAYSTRLNDIFYLNSKDETSIGSRVTVRDFDADDSKQSSGMGNFTNHTYKSMYSWYSLAKSSNTIFEYKKSDVILDGNKKRIFLWFNNQFSAKYKAPWYVVSPIFKDLKFKIEKEPQPLPNELKYFLAKNYLYTHKQDSIDRKVLAMVKTFKTKRVKEDEAKGKKQKQHIAKLESTKEKSKYITIPAMSASSYGEDRVAKFKTVEELIEGLKTLEWIPSGYEPTTAIYSTPAIFTQGWGSENEIFKAIYNRVKENDVKFGSYALSDEGEKELKKLAKNIPINKTIPFIEWTKDGKHHSLVLPFLKPINDVKKYVSDKKYLTKVKKKQATIEMTLTYNPKHDGTVANSFSMFGGALGGSISSEQTDVIFKKSWNLDEVSDTPVDVYFPATTAFYTDNNGTHQDSTNALSVKKVEPKVLTVQITMPDGKLDTYEHHFQENQKLKDVFFTFALATPDMSVNVLNEMEKKRVELFKDKNETKISTETLFKWTNRSKIYKFITMQTKYEKSLVKKLKVQVKRNKTSRAIISIVEKNKNNKLVSSLDLRRVFSDVYGERKAINSFNIMSSLMATESEKVSAYNPKNSINAFEIMKQKNIIIISNNIESKKAFLHEMKNKKLPKFIEKRLFQSDKIWFFPENKNLSIKQWAWLEVNPLNYKMNSVLEDGKYGMVDYSITVTETEAKMYFVGLVGGMGVGGWSVSYTSLKFSSLNYTEMIKVAETIANYVACGVLAIDALIPTTSNSTDIIKGVYASGSNILGCTVLNGNAMRVAGAIGGKGIALQEVLNLGFAQGVADGVAYYFMIKK